MSYRLITNLIEQVDAWDVDAVAFNYINQVISRGIIFEDNISIVDAVLSQDCLLDEGIVNLRAQQFSKYRQ